jgi:hypothetical protein
MQDPVPSAGDQSGVAVFLKVLLDQELDDRARWGDRGWKWVGMGIADTVTSRCVTS